MKQTAEEQLNTQILSHSGTVNVTDGEYPCDPIPRGIGRSAVRDVRRYS